MKILTVLGARPQFIKAATVSRQLKGAGVQEIIVHTGQHFDHNMSQVFFEEMEIPQPNYNLEISGLNHGAMIGYSPVMPMPPWICLASRAISKAV